MTSKSQAQVISDGTLSTEVTTSDELNFNITGSSQEGKNLFHSFREFSVPTGGSAIFANDMDVQNIISRVTGGSISHINGLIQTQGSANLFLLNPKGIIFGRNAQLDIGGSFIASTANQINFGDGTIFSATDLESQPLLTVNIPVGLQFREKPGNIINRSIVNEGLGLNVQSGKTLALVGSDVFLEGGVLTAIGGRIELGSVAAPAFVSLNPITAGWVLGYSSVQNFQDIRLSQGAVVQTTAEGIGDIQLQGRRIAITGKSQVVRFNYGADPGGVITIKASESVQVSGESNLTTTAFLTGAAADIIIETRRLFVRDNDSLIRDNDSFIETTTRGDGRGGNLIVNATESVEVDGGGQGDSALRTQTLASGNAGDLKIRTDRLILSNGGLLASSTNGVGDGGAISIEDSELIEVSGQGVLDDEVFPSGLFARTSGDEATGSGGTISINTERLVIKDRGAISVAAAEGSIGQAGTLEINALESVVVSGTGSTLLTESESPKAAGDLTISTGQLIVQNGGEVSASGTAEGGAGNLQINAPSIRLNQQGVLRAETRAGEGNITLQAQDIILRDNSKITTNATGEASGGNITINTGVLAALENSDITADAEAAQGGRVSITAQGIFGTEESDITARSALGPEFSGTVVINTPEVDPSRGLVELPETVVDPAALIAQNPCRRDAESEFIITGRGGLPPNPNEDLSTEAVQVGLVKPVSPPETEAQSQRASLDTSPIQNPKPPGRTESEQRRKTKNPIVPAQGWVFNDDKGEVVLTAYTPTVTDPQRQPTNPAICPAPLKK